MKKIIFLFICLISLSINAKASTWPVENFGFSIDGSSNLPYVSGIGANATKNLNIGIYLDGTDYTRYSYLILDICSTGTFDVEVTGSCTSSCFNRGVIEYYNSHKRCLVSGYTGELLRYQVRVEKFQDYTGDSEYKAFSQFNFTSKIGWYSVFSINNLVLSDEDVLSELIEQQKQQQKQDETNSKIDATNSKLDEAEKTRKGILGVIQSVLNGIINLPNLIWNAIKGGFETIANGLSAVGNLIKNALESLGNFLIEGIKGLFVPADEQLYEIVNDASNLSENFGFVGQSVSFFINIFTSLLGMVNANGCIELPEFTIGETTLFDSFTFWQAQNVCLGDNAILSANISTIRTITSIVLVCLFINFAARQFFSILSKKDSNDASISAYEVGER